MPPAPILPPPGSSAVSDSATGGTVTLAAAQGLPTIPSPRRGYGPVDMKLNPCMTLENDHALSGKGCASGIVVFGPYVGVPADSDVDVSFEVETRDKIAIVSDVVSNSAQVFHGSLLEQWVDAGQKRQFGYRVHIFKHLDSLESRIFVRADSAVEFKIRDLIVNVH